MKLSGRILIIEDEASLRQTMTRIMRQAGCEVAAAANGPEALQRLGNSAYDLAYLDIHLPEMDGLQVLKEIHKMHPQMPVVLFTAYASLETAVEAMRLGATDYLLKPLNPEVLLNRTENILKKQTVERRRRELQSQISSIQDELRKLEESLTPNAQPSSPSSSRFLKMGRLSLDLQARRAIFAERAVENGEEHICFVLRIAYGRIGRKNKMLQPIQLSIFKLSDHIVTCQPMAFARDADLRHFVFGGVEHRQHRTRGHERNIMFAGASAEDHGNAQLTGCA